MRWIEPTGKKGSGISLGASVVLLLATLVSACDVVSDLSEGLEKSDKIADALERELGSRPRVGWQINNGVLTNVNVMFKGEELLQKPLPEVAEVVIAVVNEHFELAPRQTVVSFSFDTPQ